MSDWGGRQASRQRVCRQRPTDVQRHTSHSRDPTLYTRAFRTDLAGRSPFLQAGSGNVRGIDRQEQDRGFGGPKPGGIEPNIKHQWHHMDILVARNSSIPES